jgi:hypothetical protein
MDNGLIFPYYLKSAKTDGVTQEDRPSGCWTCRSKPVGGVPRKIRELIQPREAMGRAPAHKLVDSTLPRKTTREFFG